MAQVEIDRGEELQTGQESADEEEQAEGGERRGPPEPEGFARGEHRDEQHRVGDRVYPTLHEHQCERAPRGRGPSPLLLGEDEEGEQPRDVYERDELVVPS